MRLRRRPDATVAAPDTLEQHVELEHDDRTRSCLLHIPACVRGQADVPLVLAFHGGMGRGALQAEQSGLTAVAEREGFIVAYPEGTGRMPRMLTWNAGSCCGYAIKHDVDDVGFVRALVAKLVTDFDVDAKRVYATGMSNGGMLCYRLALEASDVIAAIGVVSSTMNIERPAPPRAVPILHFHGMADPNVQFEGGVGPNQVQKNAHHPVPETIHFWVKANGCRPEPERTNQPEGTIERYEPETESGAPVVLYKLAEGGHTWPGGVDVTERWNTGKLVDSLSASSLMWDFFRDIRLP